MKHLDDLPQRGEAHDTAEEAEAAFRDAVDAGKLFVIQQSDRNDYGTDVQIEARDGTSMTNIRAHVQLKGTRRAANANGAVSVAVPRANLNYLLAHADSMYVCHHIPSGRLLVCYADDVYREYEHRGDDWTSQHTVTVTFTQLFDLEFQHRLNARRLTSGRSTRNHRLEWVGAPPDKISALVQAASIQIEIPANPAHAEALLAGLYRTGNDSIISGLFSQFSAVLDSAQGAMDFAYMAEINLGVNGEAVDADRVREGIKAFRAALERGTIHPGSLLYCIGNAWLALRENKNARDEYRAALALLDAPELSNIAAQCCKNLGAALEALSETEEARACYEQALELNPDLSEAHFALALWHRRNGNDSQLSLQYFDCITPQGNTPLQMSAVQGWRSELLFSIGDTGGAFREINNLLAQAKKLDWIWPWCARLVARFGKTATAAAQALRFWRAYLREHPADIGAERERLMCMWCIHLSGGPLVPISTNSRERWFV